MKVSLIIIITILLVDKSISLNNGLVLTPPMGWMTWQRFRCVTECDKYPDECISENLIKRTVDLLVSEGYRDAGYKYVVVDDCWMARERDSGGRLQADPDRFPSGIRALADYTHQNGLKFGIYEDYGTNTCGGYPGMEGHLETDAQTFADWEVDYIKVDGCYSEIETMHEGYIEFGKLLNATGRSIVYSCSWPVYQELSGIYPDYGLVEETCNLWRNYGDIDDSYETVEAIVNYFALNQERFIPHAGPGHWNDPDMLLLGNFGLSVDQSKAQMATWAILASPLFLSTDLAKLDPEIKGVLQNEKVIAVNQDPLGLQGRLVKQVNNIEIWTRPITPVSGTRTSFAVAFVSRRTDGMPYPVSVGLQEIGLDNPDGYFFQDLFDNDAPFAVEANSTFSTRVIPTGVKMYSAVIRLP